MKLALCTHNSRIAPKYYDATALVLVTIHNGTVEHRRDIAVETLTPDELCTLVRHMKVDVVICGGIRKDYQEKLKEASIELIYNVIGNVDDVVKKFLEGRLYTGEIVRTQTEREDFV